jgi:hypothetical protein
MLVVAPLKRDWRLEMVGVMQVGCPWDALGMHLGCTLRMALLACFIGESVDFGWRGMQVAAKSIFSAGGAPVAGGTMARVGGC